MLSEIDTFASAHPWLLSAGALILGALLSHRYSLARDKRKEFNAVIDPVRVELRRQLRNVSPMDAIPKGFDAIEDRLFWFRQAGFRRAVDEYKQARQQQCVQDATGSITGYSRTDRIQNAIRTLLRYMGRR